MSEKSEKNEALINETFSKLDMRVSLSSFVINFNEFKSFADAILVSNPQNNTNFLTHKAIVIKMWGKVKEELENLSTFFDNIKE
jgi:hypothetical protein